MKPQQTAKSLHVFSWLNTIHCFVSLHSFLYPTINKAKWQAVFVKYINNFTVYVTTIVLSFHKQTSIFFTLTW